MNTFVIFLYLYFIFHLHIRLVFVLMAYHLRLMSIVWSLKACGGRYRWVLAFVRAFLRGLIGLWIGFGVNVSLGLISSKFRHHFISFFLLQFYHRHIYQSPDSYTTHYNDNTCKNTYPNFPPQPNKTAKISK